MNSFFQKTKNINLKKLFFKNEGNFYKFEKLKF